jgi:hypothetical protein
VRHGKIVVDSSSKHSGTNQHTNMWVENDNCSAIVDKSDVDAD